jgi:hypothetical protein
MALTTMIHQIMLIARAQFTVKKKTIRKVAIKKNGKR